MFDKFVTEDGEKVEDYYVIIKVAKYLGVAPWDLVEQPTFWVEAALDVMQADAAHERAESRKLRKALKEK